MICAVVGIPNFVFRSLFVYTMIADIVLLGNNKGHCNRTTLFVVWEMVEVTLKLRRANCVLRLRIVLPLEECGEWSVE